MATEERSKEEAAAEEVARQAKEAKDRAYTEVQARIRAEQTLAKATASREKAEKALLGKPRDLLAGDRRRALSKRVLAAAALVAAVGGGAYFAASKAPVPVAGVAGTALTSPAGKPAIDLGPTTPLKLRLDGEWQTTAAKSRKP